MILGIAGYAGSGKDEIAKRLEDKWDFQRVGMSDALHEYMLALNPIIDKSSPTYMSNPQPLRYTDIVDELGYVEAKAEFPEIRRLLQVLGTEVGRAIDPYMWVKERDRRITSEFCVTTGIRFQEEVESCDFLLWVDRPGFEPVNDHVSDDVSWIKEKADLCVTNDSTIQDLHVWVDFYLYPALSPTIHLEEV